MSYRFFPSTSGPGASTAFGPGICQGLAFEVTSPGMVLQGYFYWRADSSQSASATFALWTITSSTTGTFISGSNVSTSSGVTGQWNFVPLATPLALTSGTAYMVVMGQTGNFSDTHPYFNSSGPAPSGITNGPLNLYADPGGTSNTTPNGNVQGSFTTGSSDPTITFPTSANTAYNPWIDVQVDFPTAPSPPAAPGRTWLRRFHHPQSLPPAVAPVVAAGPAPLTPLHGPVTARPAPFLKGRVTGSSRGTYAQLGPPVYPLRGPVRTRPQPPPRGRTAAQRGTYAQLGAPLTPPHGPAGLRQRAPGPFLKGRSQGRTGVFTAAAGTSGPPVYPLRGPVQARLPLQPLRKGRTATMVALPLFYAGAPVYPLRGPVRTRTQPPPRGRVQGHAGTFTSTVIVSGPPVYPLGRPVQAKRQPFQGGRVIRRAGTYAQAGPPVKAAQGPVSAARRPLPSRGRTASQRGPYGQAGPAVKPLQSPVTIRRTLPLRGSAAWRSGVYTAPPAFLVARSTPTVTAPDTSAASVADPRDGTNTVTAIATSSPGVT